MIHHNAASVAADAATSHLFARKPLTLAIASVLAVLAQPAAAVTCTLTTNGDWGTAANWDCGIAPGTIDTAIINAGGDVDISQAEAVRSLNNAGMVDIDAFLLTLSSGAGSGSTNTGTINVGGGSTAALNISASHNLDNTGGTINITNGSVVNQFGSTITGGTINTTGTGALVAFVSNANFLDGVTLAGNLDMATNASSRQTVVNGLTMANGRVDVNSNSILMLRGTQTVSGTGEIVFGNTGVGNRLDLDGNGDTTLASGITVRGENGTIGGQLLQAGTQTLINEGLVSADVSGGTITITQSAVTNNSTLEARNGGTLALSSAVDNSAGTIVADNGTVSQQAVTITGGSIQTLNGGTLLVNSSSNNFLDGVSVSGNIDMSTTNTSRQRVVNGLTLNGEVNVDSNGILSFEGTNLVDGNGTIVLGSTGSGNRVDLSGNGTTTFGSDMTIRGENGTIGQQVFVAGTQVLVNNGTIAADVNGGTITITDSAVTNNGTLEAKNGGTLVLQSNVTGGTGSQISVDTGSTVLQNAITISGEINTTGNGLFSANSSANNFLTGVTLNGNLDLTSNSARERVSAGGMTLNGQIDIDNNAILSFEGTGTLDGNGTIVLGATGPGNRIDLSGNGVTTFGSNISVRGENGTIGQQVFVAGTQTLVNNGSISADVSGGTITITESAVTNNGTLEAQNGGTLILQSNVTGGAGGQIVAGAGSTVRQSAVTISGTINTAGTGLFTATSSANNFLDGVTLNGDLDLTSNSARERVTTGGLTLNGQIDINNNAILSFEGNNALNGNATIVFGDTGIGNRVDLDGNGTTVIGSNAVIRGENGTIGQQIFIAGTQVLQNDGLISADVGGGNITIRESVVTNNSTLEARNGATLTLISNVTNGAGGQILADNGTVQLQSVVIDGGTLDSTNGGTIVANLSSGNFLRGTMLNGVLDLATQSGRERVQNGMTLNGRIDIDNNGILGLEGTQTIAGSGEIVLGGNAGLGNRIDLEGNGTTTLGPGVTIRGTNGTIGQQLNVAGTQTLLNQGTINADGGGTLRFLQSAVTNDGLMRASNGTLNVDVALNGNGTLQVDTTGIADLSQTSIGPVTQGTLAMGATGAQLNLGNNDIILNSDYTNVAAGSGNSFDRRAGVSGAGQILAGGDVAQAITGANVTDGNTPNATLTIGNVRVGSTTFDYQIANTGTTGPSLRGAIQDAANGGNITDARLSGAGVTAGNYNTGGPGNDTGNLGVTFTVGSAGALAPLTGQAVNLRSNFDNIGDQVLNIALGSGAAAYNAAVGDATPTPVTVANQRVATMGPATTLSVANTAAAGSFTEKLNASFGANTGDAVNNGGSVVLLDAGSGSSNMAVNVSNNTAGAKSGTVTLNYETDGTGTSGLAAQSVGSQTINVSGDVFNVAQPTLSTMSVTIANQRVGGTLTQGLGITNTDISPAGFQESLDAAIGVIGSGVTATGPSINNLAQGATDNTSFQLGVDTTSAGAKNGNVDIAFASDGGGTSGLGLLTLAGQTVNVSGNVYKEAEGQLNTAALNFGTVQVGQGVSQVLSIDNIATGPAGFVEDLNVRFGATSGIGAGQISGAGQIDNLVAGGNDASSMVVSVNTAAAGTINGAIAIDYFTAGAVNGTSNGLGELFLNSEDYGVSGLIQTGGTIVDQADPQIDNPNIALGSVRINMASPNANVSVTNLASGNQQAALDASISGNGPITASGSFDNLLPGSTDSSSLSVGMDTSTAGAVNGTATIDFISDASNIGGCAPNCEMQLGSQDVNVSGAVYRLANGQAAGPVDLGAARVGDAATMAAIGVTNQSPDAFTEALNVSVASGTPSSPFNATGSILGLAAQASDNSSIVVSMGTATAGNFSDSVELDYVTTGTGTTNAADMATGSESVAVNGKVYAPAVKQLDTAVVDFGIVHVGDTVSAQAVGVTNAAAVAGLNDTMQASIGGLATGFTDAGGPVSGIGAGASAALSVALNTATAGVFSGAADIDFTSQNPDMADLDLGSMQVTLNAQVNNYANPDFDKTGGSGTLTGSGQLFVLDFGNVVLGQTRAATLALLNDVVGPADLLSGSYLQTDGGDGQFDFGLVGFDPFANLVAGAIQSGLDVGFTASSLGAFSDTVELMAMGTNASGFQQNFAIQLVLNANVVQGGTGNVPVPGTLLLVAPFAWWLRRRVNVVR